MYCLCVNVYCHRVSTQLQLANIYHTSFAPYGHHEANTARKCKRCSLHNVGLGIDEEASEVLHLEHSFMWC
jgi:hypothetical protein